jgi:L-lactate dehydrogenase (cytochrome)
VADLRRRARARIPGFVHDYLEGGTGAETNHPRNAEALARIEILPRYGADMAAVDPSATLFGARLAAPIATAPIGLDGAIWPGAMRHMARAAAATGLACVAGTLSTETVEHVAATNPDRTWFQLYTLPNDDHAGSLDLLRRAHAAGVAMAAVTVDIPLSGRRPRDMKNGLRLPFRVTPGALAGALTRPAWLAAYLQNPPSFANMAAYAPGGRIAQQDFVRAAGAGSGATWETLARLRDAWDRPMLIKGILHPRDARRARSLGFDGVIVSNHGGRQFDAAPAAIDMLPAIRAALGAEATVLIDGGVTSGLDVLKCLACGADGVLVGRGFLYGLAALGPAGARHVAETLIDEFRIALGQSGALTVEGARRLELRHPGRWPGAEERETT